MNKEDTSNEKENPVLVEEIKKKIRTKSEEIINFCTEEREENIDNFEKNLMKEVCKLGCLFLQLFLMACHERLRYEKWLSTELYYRKKEPISRIIKTIYGEVKYWRTYLLKKKGEGGFYPLDTVLGLTSDGFSARVMSLATKLATRVSYQAAVRLFGSFYGWAPSTESIEGMVLGIGREASKYMETDGRYEGDGEILVIETDGKATPTATKEELNKRRGIRQEKCGCGCSERCQRHRSKAKRKGKNRKRRKKGDKSKNGRSATIVVMYTLKKGNDGKLHGPINKKVWASYAPRKIMLAWAKRQAAIRGFTSETNKQVHILMDGEPCLRNRLKKLFPNASFALDIRHLEEKIWDVGRTFHPEGSEELKLWVEEKRTYLYSGSAAELLLLFKNIRNTLSKRAKRDQSKYNALTKLIKYMSKRMAMMSYQQLIEKDLPIATGIVEGAARYVIGERMDCSGMRWIPERAEALLHLRCIELNGDWDHFFAWSYKQWLKRLQQGEKVMVRTNQSIDLSLYSDSIELSKDSDCEVKAHAA